MFSSLAARRNSRRHGVLARFVLPSGRARPRRDVEHGQCADSAPSYSPPARARSWRRSRGSSAARFVRLERERRLRAPDEDAAGPGGARPHEDVGNGRYAGCEPSGAPNGVGAAENAHPELKIQAKATVVGTTASPVLACMSFSAVYYATTHSHTITVVFMRAHEPQRAAPAAPQYSSGAPACLRSESWVWRVGQRARGEVRGAVVLTVAVARAELMLRSAGRTPAPVETGSPCRRRAWRWPRARRTIRAGCGGQTHPAQLYRRPNEPRERRSS